MEPSYWSRVGTETFSRDHWILVARNCISQESPSLSPHSAVSPQRRQGKAQSRWLTQSCPQAPASLEYLCRLQLCLYSALREAGWGLRWIPRPISTLCCFFSIVSYTGWVVFLHRKALADSVLVWPFLPSLVPGWHSAFHTMDAPADFQVNLVQTLPWTRGKARPSYAVSWPSPSLNWCHSSPAGISCFPRNGNHPIMRTAIIEWDPSWQKLARLRISHVILPGFKAHTSIKCL